MKTTNDIVKKYTGLNSQFINNIKAKLENTQN